MRLVVAGTAVAEQAGLGSCCLWFSTPLFADRVSVLVLDLTPQNEFDSQSSRATINFLTSLLTKPRGLPGARG